MIISRTPLRVSFFGGGSDLPGYYRQAGGAVLSTTIDKSVYVTVSQKFDSAIRVSYSRTEEVDTVSEIKHPLVREALRLRGIEGGVEIVSIADVPSLGTGLGSSSSFTVGLLNALAAYRGAYAPAAQLARESCEIEIGRCHEPIGKQDQYAAAFGGLNLIRFNPDETVEVCKVISSPETLYALQQRLLFFYTGITRSASELLREQSVEISKPSGPAARGLSSMADMAVAGFDALCAGRIEEIGPMLHEAWTIKRGLSSGISNSLIDDAYEAALRAGADGGKLLGAGGGGFLMFCADPSRHDAIREALRGLRETRFAFEAQGSNIIFVH